jgi:hypothetical protein
MDARALYKKLVDSGADVRGDEMGVVELCATAVDAFEVISGSSTIPADLLVRVLDTSARSAGMAFHYDIEQDKLPLETLEVLEFVINERFSKLILMISDDREIVLPIDNDERFFNTLTLQPAPPLFKGFVLNEHQRTFRVCSLPDLVEHVLMYGLILPGTNTILHQVTRTHADMDFSPFFEYRMYEIANENAI